MRAEIPNSPQQKDRGMASSGSSGPEVTIIGCGRAPIRAVSFFALDLVKSAGRGSGALSAPGGFGKGCRRGEAVTAEGGTTAGETGRGIVSELEATNAVIFGGTRRTGATGVREGRTILTVSCLAALPEGEALSGRGGSAMRTGSFFGSVMGGPSVWKMAQRTAPCHPLNCMNCRAFL
jgi:hypothetical protein